MCCLPSIKECLKLMAWQVFGLLTFLLCGGLLWWLLCLLSQRLEPETLHTLVVCL